MCSGGGGRVLHVLVFARLQRQDGLMQRSIREVNTSSRWCVLWDLDEDTHYSVQVQSVGPHDEPAMEGLGMTPHLQTGELLIITTVLLLWAVRSPVTRVELESRPGLESETRTRVRDQDSTVIALFCRQYDIIKDNDSSSSKDKSKRPLVRAAPPYYNASAGSSPIYHNGAVHGSRVTHLYSLNFINKLSHLSKPYSSIAFIWNLSIMHDDSWLPGVL
ncbi:hypothetical protein FQN60_006560 [Etheostoma spectabile]|uniref:Fibronectin type-III domain-containing protein n=1 Tax=Etheostoma spectabile TaxID=54343 RepID=A0A5J5CCL3_9PERO|nr:hypothetical protein FQN60_006560 [Etheostoma spectabile]